MLCKDPDARKYCVYFHRRGDTGDVFYVGSGMLDRPYRFQCGRSESWHAIVAAYGITIEVLETGLTKDEALARECALIAEARKDHALVNIQDCGTRKEEIRHFRDTHGRFPSTSIPEEKKLAQKLYAYCRPRHRSYDADFRIWAESRGYGTGLGVQAQRCESVKQEIRRFFALYGRFPVGSIAAERGLNGKLGQYCCRVSAAYDPEFHIWCVERGYGQKQRKK